MNKLHTDSCLGMVSNPGKWCCEAAVLTTEPLCHQIWLVVLNTAKAIDPDKILAILLKTCAPQFTAPLAKLVQYSYNTDIYLKLWKLP
eukprot:g28308.t1